MTHTYYNYSRNLFLNVEASTDTEIKIVRIYNWLYNKHEDIYWIIELHETGYAGISVTDDAIVISGDNGCFEMERIEIDQI